MVLVSISRRVQMKKKKYPKLKLELKKRADRRKTHQSGNKCIFVIFFLFLFGFVIKLSIKKKSINF